MAKSWPVFPLLLLCAVTASVKGNAENTTTEHHQTTTTSGQTGSEPHPEQHSTAEPLAPEDEDSSSGSEEETMPQANSTELNTTNAYRYNNTNRPNFRRYVDLRKNFGIVEKRVDDAWVRLRPPMEDGEVQETNITRYIYFANGSRIALRSKFDYSFDDVTWFRSSRIKIPIAQFANGTTIYQYRFGPKRWIGAYRNRVFHPNANPSELNLNPGGPHHSVYRFDEEEAFFKAPRGFNMGNGTGRKQVYKYGPVTDRNYAVTKFGRQFYNRLDHRPLPYGHYDDRRWNPRGFHPEYYGRRPPYPGPRHAYNEPYDNDARYRQGEGGYYDRRYRPAGPYEEPRYPPPGGAYDDRRYNSGPGYNDERYRSDGHQPARGYDDRKYPPQANEPSYRTYDTRSSADRNYDTRGSSDRSYETRAPPDRTHDTIRGASDRSHETRGASDRSHETRGASDRSYETRGPSDRAPRYDEKRYDRGYDNSYDRRDRRPYEGYSSGSNNGSGYDERSSYDNKYPREQYNNRQTVGRRRYAESINRPHGESYEEFKWKFPYLDKSRIPADETKREKYFIREYCDILAKTSKNLWKLHRHLRTILPEYDEIRQDVQTTSDPSPVANVVNSSMTLINNLISRIDNKMESNLTKDDVAQPIDRGTYTKTMNGFDKIVDILRELKNPEARNENLEDLITKLVDYKRSLYVLYSDITHMIMVLRRTMKKYGFYITGA